MSGLRHEHERKPVPTHDEGQGNAKVVENCSDGGGRGSLFGRKPDCRQNWRRSHGNRAAEAVEEVTYVH